MLNILYIAKIVIFNNYLISLWEETLIYLWNNTMDIESPQRLLTIFNVFTYFHFICNIWNMSFSNMFTICWVSIHYIYICEQNSTAYMYLPQKHLVEADKALAYLFLNVFEIVSTSLLWKLDVLRTFIDPPHDTLLFKLQTWRTFALYQVPSV